MLYFLSEVTGKHTFYELLYIRYIVTRIRQYQFVKISCNQKKFHKLRQEKITYSIQKKIPITFDLSLLFIQSTVNQREINVKQNIELNQLKVSSSIGEFLLRSSFFYILLISTRVDQHKTSLYTKTKFKRAGQFEQFVQVSARCQARNQQKSKTAKLLGGRNVNEHIHSLNSLGIFKDNFFETIQYIGLTFLR